MAAIYVGVNNQAKKIKKIYVGVNGVAKEVKKGYIGVNGVAKLFYTSSLLPSTYQAVEYIMNSGSNKYLKTGVKPDSNTTVYAKFKWTMGDYTGYPSDMSGSSAYYSSPAIFGAYHSRVTSSSDTVKKRYYLGSRQTNFNYLEFGFGSSSQWAIANLRSDTIQEFLFNSPGGYFYQDGSLIYTSTETFSAHTSELLIFANSEGVSRDKVYFYQFSVWQNNNPIRDMYPCYRKSDNVIGMYDIINNVFYTNQGTGTFYKGPDIEL